VLKLENEESCDKMKDEGRTLKRMTISFPLSQQSPFLLSFSFLLLSFLAFQLSYSLIMIVYRYARDFLCFVLSNHKLIQMFLQHPGSESRGSMS
jgi:hypothetical protein